MRRCVAILLLVGCRGFAQPRVLGALAWLFAFARSATFLSGPFLCQSCGYKRMHTGARTREPHPGQSLALFVVREFRLADMLSEALSTLSTTKRHRTAKSYDSGHRFEIAKVAANHFSLMFRSSRIFSHVTFS